MYTDEDLHAAVKAGIFSEHSISEFRQFIAHGNHSTVAEEEHFRLVSGFNDIFVSVAALLFMVSAGWVGAQFALPFGYALFASIAWGLAKFFVLKRRLALPAIVLLFSFIGGVVGSTLHAMLALGLTIPHAILLAGLSGLIAAAIHWVRFRVPVTVAAGAASIILCVIVFFILLPQGDNLVTPLSLISGLLSFALAMYWDSRDTARQTRKSDVAFWLHLLAAPLIVHPVFSMLGIFEATNDLVNISIVIVLYVAMAVVSIAIDRRALMVSALAYVLYALSDLLKTYGTVSFRFAIAGIVIGSMLLLLSAFWHKSRQIVVNALSPRYQKLVPPVKRQMLG